VGVPFGHFDHLVDVVVEVGVAVHEDHGHVLGVFDGLVVGVGVVFGRAVLVGGAVEVVVEAAVPDEEDGWDVDARAFLVAEVAVAVFVELVAGLYGFGGELVVDFVFGLTAEVDAVGAFDEGLGGVAVGVAVVGAGGAGEDHFRTPFGTFRVKNCGEWRRSVEFCGFACGFGFH
jgi:hypothetical protein